MPSRRAVSVLVTNRLRFWPGASFAARSPRRRRARRSAARDPCSGAQPVPREVLDQRARVPGVHRDATGPERSQGVDAEPADRPDGDPIARRPQHLRVHVRERLVLGEVLEADDDPRSRAPPPVAAERIRVDELAADRLRQAPVPDLLVERPQRTRGQYGRGSVQPAADVPRSPWPERAQQLGADHRDDRIRADHPAVVAQRQHIRARDLRIRRERHGDLRLTVVERRDAGVRDRQRYERRA